MSSSAVLEALRALGIDPARLREDPDFTRWRDKHTVLRVDGETLYLRAGDHLADEDQLLLEWVRRSTPVTGSAEPNEFLDIEGGSE